MQDAARRAVREFVAVARTEIACPTRPTGSSQRTATRSIDSASDRHPSSTSTSTTSSGSPHDCWALPSRSVDVGLLGSAVARPQTTVGGQRRLPGRLDEGGCAAAVDREQPRADRREQATRLARHRRVPRAQRHRHHHRRQRRRLRPRHGRRIAHDKHRQPRGLARPTRSERDRITPPATLLDERQVPPAVGRLEGAGTTPSLASGWASSIARRQLGDVILLPAGFGGEADGASHEKQTENDQARPRKHRRAKRTSLLTAPIRRLRAMTPSPTMRAHRFECNEARRDRALSRCPCRGA